MGSDSGKDSGNEKKEQTVVDPNKPKSGQWDEQRHRTLGYNDFINDGMYGPDNATGEENGKPDYKGRRAEWNKREKLRSLVEGRPSQSDEAVLERRTQRQSAAQRSTTANSGGFTDSKPISENPLTRSQLSQPIENVEADDWDPTWLGHDEARQTPNNQIKEDDNTSITSSVSSAKPTTASQGRSTPRAKPTIPTHKTNLNLDGVDTSDPDAYHRAQMKNIAALGAQQEAEEKAQKAEQERQRRAREQEQRANQKQVEKLAAQRRAQEHQATKRALLDEHHPAYGFSRAGAKKLDELDRRIAAERHPAYGHTDKGRALLELRNTLPGQVSAKAGVPKRSQNDQARSLNTATAPAIQPRLSAEDIADIQRTAKALTKTDDFSGIKTHIDDILKSASVQGRLEVQGLLNEVERLKPGHGHKMFSDLNLGEVGLSDPTTNQKADTERHPSYGLLEIIGGGPVKTGNLATTQDYFDWLQNETVVELNKNPVSTFKPHWTGYDMPPSGTIRALTPSENFWTFNPVGQFVDQMVGYPASFFNRVDGVPVSPISRRGLSPDEEKAAKQTLMMDIAAGGVGKLANTAKKLINISKEWDRLLDNPIDVSKLGKRALEDVKSLAHSLDDAVRGLDVDGIGRVDSMSLNTHIYGEHLFGKGKSALDQPNSISNIRQKGDFYPPNDPALPSFEITTSKKTGDFVRVVPEHQVKEPAGQWMMSKDDFTATMRQPDGAGVLKDKFALPSDPTHVVDVNVPVGEKLEIGIAQGHPKWGPGGGVQFRSKERLDKKVFTNSRPIGHNP